MSKISVIVPVFNVENYIAKCLDSLINQTLDNIEIIVVNDVSTDNSQKIISLIKEHSGMSDARNFGLKMYE
ncbi:glycosyltransferase [uncultured Clostridium sp.]|uniref:glycosyltransferase family 2 protein n=1 Tax=uncultured Clostridium sp. TaxID=59620 RepID=UPI0025CD1487|nr:glycosyltransferase [uncultured Clostridium sp.]